MYTFFPKLQETPQLQRAPSFVLTAVSAALVCCALLVVPDAILTAGTKTNMNSYVAFNASKRFDAATGFNTSVRKLVGRTTSPTTVLNGEGSSPQGVLDNDIKHRCFGTIGGWCGPYLKQRPTAKVAPPTGNRTCLWGCNFVGVCDALSGWCQCPAGWTGDSCNTRQKRPCSQHNRAHGLEPFIGETDLSKPGLTLRCAGFCDEDTATCYCPSDTPYGRIPADPALPPGTPPVRIGRPLSHLCQPNKDKEGNPSNFGDKDPRDLFDPGRGWCAAEEPALHCPCLQDGLTGQLCDRHTEMFCPNQCSGRGECLHGFCKCQKGWFGQDCAYRSTHGEQEAKSHSASDSPGLHQKERPWLTPHVHTPAAEAAPTPGSTRLRPLIYVYELPPFYNQVMLQYRMDKGSCTHRLFSEANETVFNDGWLYGIETALHEMMLQSEHRTLDPEEADFFYLPVYTSCLIFPILGAADFPFFHGGPAAFRTHAAANMLIEVYHWVRSHHPYWDRKGGRDHILTMPHDEGSCWVPAVLRPAIILSYWGRRDLDHVSGTGYWPDNYTANSHHPVYQPEGHTGKLGDFPCYDPSKDLVVPVFSSHMRFLEAPFLGAHPLPRTILAFFRGRTQPHNPAYSRGTRQFLAKAAAEHKWWEKHRVFIAESGNPAGLEGQPYSQLMASSVFCPALMGDGFSSRFTDAILHGCIPVAIMDGVDLEYSSLLDVESFSLRVAQADMAQLPQILEQVPLQRVRELQEGLGRVWHRYFWGAYQPMREAVLRIRNGTSGPQAAGRESSSSSGGEDGGAEAGLLGHVFQPKAPPHDPAQDDAFSTLLQWLYTRM